MKLNTYNNGIAESWEIGSKTIIPTGIIEKLRNKDFELVNNDEGIEIKLNGKLEKIGKILILENDKLSVMSKTDFNKKYTLDVVEGIKDEIPTI